MDQTIDALIEHLDSQVDKYGVQSVKLYAGEFADADSVEHILPAILVVPPSLDTTRLNYRMEFSLLIVSETLGYDRESNAEENLLLGWRIYHWLKNNSIFTDGSSRYRIGVQGGQQGSMRAKIAVFSWRHVVTEIELTIWKKL